MADAVNIYCDESGHLPNDGPPAMPLSAVGDEKLTPPGWTAPILLPHMVDEHREPYPRSTNVSTPLDCFETIGTYVDVSGRARRVRIEESDLKSRLGAGAGCGDVRGVAANRQPG